MSLSLLNVHNTKPGLNSGGRRTWEKKCVHLNGKLEWNAAPQNIHLIRTFLKVFASVILNKFLNYHSRLKLSLRTPLIINWRLNCGYVLVNSSSVFGLFSDALGLGIGKTNANEWKFVASSPATSWSPASFLSKWVPRRVSTRLSGDVILTLWMQPRVVLLEWVRLCGHRFALFSHCTIIQ